MDTIYFNRKFTRREGVKFMLKKTTIAVGTVAVLSLLGGSIAFAQTASPSPTTTVSPVPTSAVTPTTGQVQGTTTIPAGAPATGFGN